MSIRGFKRRATRQRCARLLCLERYARTIERRSNYLQGFRDLELDLERASWRVLLASLLLAPTRPQFRQPSSAQTSDEGNGPRRRRVPA